MKNKLLALILISSMLLSMSACAKAKNQRQAQSAQDIIKIGWVGALTGDSSSWGQCELNTIKLLFEQINSEGGVLGKKLEIVGYDTKGDPFETTSAVKLLTEKDKIVALIGPNTSSSAIATGAVLEQAKVPGIATVATNPDVTMNNGTLRPFNFRVCFTDAFQGTAAAGYALESLGTVKAAILFDSRDKYSQELAKYFEKYYTENGGTIVAKESFSSGDTDFSEQLSRILSVKPQLLFIPCYYREAALTAIQVRKLGSDAILMGGDGWPSDQLYPLSEGKLEGAYYVSHYNPSASNNLDFKRIYEAKYGSNAELNVFLAHDAVLMLVDAIKRAGKPNSELIAKALETTDIKGLTGRIRIGRYTHSPEEKEASIIKIEDGKELFQQYYIPH